MPTKTGDKIRIIVLGTGPDAETARLIAESDADVALAAKFTKTVTHLVIDDTVKTSEARVKKAEEAGVPVLTFAEFKALLVAGTEDEVAETVEEAAEAEPEVAPTPVVAADVTATDVVGTDAAATDVVDEVPDAGPEVIEETGAATEPDPVQEPEPVADPEPRDAEEPVAQAEPAAEPVAGSGPAAEKTAESVEESKPVAEAIDEPETAAADPDKAVPSQADAPAIENDAASDKSGSKPGLLAKIKSIFGMTGARK